MEATGRIMSQVYAPIVLFVYNRPWHTEQTLNALMQNELADQSVLYIYADGPKANETDEQLKKITEVRQLIRSKNWCKEVHIIEVEKNKGLADSIIDGVTEIINEYGKVIVLEDDIVTSNQFLLFMNKALEYYQCEEIIFGISGYTYPSKFPITDTHFLPIGCSWGWATWKERWQTVNFDAMRLEEEIINQKKELKFNFGNYPFFEMLQAQINGKIASWAIRFYASFFLQDKMFVYPDKSLVINKGFDNTASHTTSSDNFFDKILIEEINFKFKEPLFDENTENIKQKFKENFYLHDTKKPSKVHVIATKIYTRLKKAIE